MILSPSSKAGADPFLPGRPRQKSPLTGKALFLWPVVDAARKQTLSWTVSGAGGAKISRNIQQQGEILPALLSRAPALRADAAQGSRSFLRASLPHRRCKHKGESAITTAAAAAIKPNRKKKKKKKESKRWRFLHLNNASGIVSVPPPVKGKLSWEIPSPLVKRKERLGVVIKEVHPG